MNWNTLKLRQFEAIDDLQKEDLSDDEKFIRTVAILNDMDIEKVENMPLAGFRNLDSDMSFMVDTPRQVKFPSKYVLNGHTYILNSDLKKFTVAQYIDFQEFVKGRFKTSTVLTVFLIPEGHTYNDGYDMVEVIRDMGELDMISVNSITLFFSLSLKSLMLGMLAYFDKKVKRMKEKEREKMKVMILEQMKRVMGTDGSGSF